MADFLVTPKSLLPSFILASDRQYFSAPIRVEVLYSEVSTRFLIVRDPLRGHTYPTRPEYVRAPWQRKAVA